MVLVAAGVDVIHQHYGGNDGAHHHGGMRDGGMRAAGGCNQPIQLPHFDQVTAKRCDYERTDPARRLRCR